MNKKLLTLVTGSILSCTAGSAFSALPVKAQFQIDRGFTAVTDCVLGSINSSTGNCTLDGITNISVLNITAQKGSFFKGPIFNSDGINLDMLNPADLSVGGLQLSRSQNSSGSHRGAPNGNEFPLIDAPWLLGSNTGMHGTTTPVVTFEGSDGTGDGIASLDFQGWFITWNDVAVIPLGGCQLGDRANNAGFSTCDTNQDGTDDLDLNFNKGRAFVACYTAAEFRDAAVASTGTTVPDGDCSEGNFYFLDYTANVPVGDPSNLGGTDYTLHLEGVIADTNLAPVATADPLSVSMAVSTDLAIDLAANATDPDGDGLNVSSCTVTYTGTRSPAPTITPAPGLAGSCSITYLDNDGLSTTAGNEDTFDYTIADILGKVSSPITVRVGVFADGPHLVANPFSVTTDANTPVLIDILTSITNGNNAVDIAAISTFDPVNGTVGNPNLSQQIRFTPDADFTGVASFDYAVSDKNGVTSNTATITIKVNSRPVVSPPVTRVTLKRNTSLIVKVSDIASDSDGGIDNTRTVTTAGINGGSTVASINVSNVGIITYTPPSSTYVGDDEFNYTVFDADNAGAIGAYILTVVNVAPVAHPDTVSINTLRNTDINIDVLSNDVDVDGSVEAVNIVTQPLAGTAVVTSGCVFQDNAGQPLPPVTCIAYTPPTGITGQYFLEYTVNDNDGTASNVVRVVVTVSGTEFSASPQLLILDTGNVANRGVKPAEGEGSWFSLQLEPLPAPPIYTPISGFDHLQLSNTIFQPATSIPVVQGIDIVWLFAGSPGVHKTDSPVKVLQDDGEGNILLDFSGWGINWNGINFSLGSGEDDELARMKCAVDCSIGDTFTLDYLARALINDAAHVLNTIGYALHLEGTVALELIGIVENPIFDVTDISVKNSDENIVIVVPGNLASAAGKITGTGLTFEQVSRDPLLNIDDGEQCIGGCLDFIASDLTGDFIKLVVNLNRQLPDGVIYRRNINGIWADFDISQGDQIGSAAAESGKCEQPEGVFWVGLREGDQCIFLRIRDGGPNDADGIKNGRILNQSGVLLAGSPGAGGNNGAGNSSSGCSISPTSVAITERLDWLLVMVFFVVVFFRRKSI